MCGSDCAAEVVVGIRAMMTELVHVVDTEKNDSSGERKEDAARRCK